MSEPIAPTRHAFGRVAVATASPLATQVAARVLAQGGGAADAVLAAQAVLCLVEPNASGLGGGCVILWQDACSGASGVVDGLSCAPARVTTRLELDFDGRMIPAERALTGGRSVGVPGALRALELLHGRFGRLGWADCLAPAIVLAEDGVPMPRYLAKTLGEITAMRDEPLAQSALLGPDHRPLPSGTVFRNPALARSLREIAEDGAGALYEGRIARAMLDKVTADLLPGTLTAADLAGYRAVQRVPLRARLGGGTVLTAPPPVFGGMAMGQIIGLVQAQGFLARIPAAAPRRCMRCARPGASPSPIAAPMSATRISARRRRRHCSIRLSCGAGRADPAGCHAAAGHGRAYPGLRAGRAGWRHERQPDQPPGGDGCAGDDGLHDHDHQPEFRLAPLGRRLLPEQCHDQFRPASGGEGPGRAQRAGAGQACHDLLRTVDLLDATGAVQAAIGAGGGNRIVGFVANGLLRIAAGQTDAAALVAAPHGMCAGSFADLEPPLQPHAAALRQRGHYVMLRRMDGGTQALIRNGEIWNAGGDPRRDRSVAALDQPASA